MVGDPLNRAADGIPAGAETRGDARLAVGCARTRVAARFSAPAGRAVPLARSTPLVRSTPLARSVPRATATPAPVATLRAASTPSAAAPARNLLRRDTLSAYAAAQVTPGQRRRRPSRAWSPTPPAESRLVSPTPPAESRVVPGRRRPSRLVFPTSPAIEGVSRLRHRCNRPAIADATGADRGGRWRRPRRPGDWSSAMVLIEEVADGGWALRQCPHPNHAQRARPGKGPACSVRVA
jgi:hypothetical protein